MAKAMTVATAVVAALSSTSEAVGRHTRHSVSAETGVGTWETERRGVHVRLTQIGSLQARAFMLARGMDATSANEFAGSCVFMSVLRNGGKAPIHVRLSDWRYAPQGQAPRSMLTKHDWLNRWQSRNFPPAVRIAFEWSQFPVEQTFAPGDWNQGMTSYDLPAGSRFDVIFRWRQGGRLHEGKLTDVECADRTD